MSNQPSAYLELTKPRLSLLVLSTTLAGYLLAPAAELDGRLLATLVATLMVVGGANALNQVYERELDGLMRRTRGRPLPSGRLWAGQATGFAVALGLVGVVVLGVWINVPSAILAAAGFALYVFVYTPMKRRSEFCTLVGAVPGAIPPMIGWTATTGVVDGTAAILFAILVCWQMPHFLAIARLFREDYRRAGMVMVGIREDDGARAYRHMVAYTAALIPASLALSWNGTTGLVFAAGSGLLGFGFLTTTVRALTRADRAGDRTAFLYSLAYLPALLLVMFIDRQTWG